MASIKAYKRNAAYVDVANLVEELGNAGPTEILYYNKPFEREAKSIVARPSFIRSLNKLFGIQISAGDIL